MPYATAWALPGSGTPAAGAADAVGAASTTGATATGSVIEKASRLSTEVGPPATVTDCSSITRAVEGDTTEPYSDAAAEEADGGARITAIKAKLATEAKIGSDHAARVWRPEMSPPALFSCARRSSIRECLPTVKEC